jgi:GMP reductase
MRIIDDVKLDFKDVLFVPKRSTLKSRKDVELVKTYKFKNSGLSWSGVPIMASNMDGVGTFGVHKVLSEHQLLTALIKHYSLEDWLSESPQNRKHLVPSIGTSYEDVEQLFYILTAYSDINFVCVDVANGYTTHFLRFIEHLRKELDGFHRPVTIIAGNVVTPEITEELILTGVDIVKVGIGPGAQCTTRIQTGVGYPQLSTIIECADAAHGLGGHIIADGGCTCPGDVAKAFGANADFVMLGSMFAGHLEGNGELITEYHHNGKYRHDENKNFVPEIVEKKYVKFYGMSSKTAQQKHNGFKEYRASEGRTTMVPYKGEIENTVQEILGGLRSCCTYVGAANLKELPKRTTFVRVSETHNKTHEQFTIGK